MPGTAWDLHMQLYNAVREGLLWSSACAWRCVRGYAGPRWTRLAPWRALHENVDEAALAIPAKAGYQVGPHALVHSDAAECICSRCYGSSCVIRQLLSYGNVSPMVAELPWG